MGKRMFDAGAQAWPEEAPFHTPVFVLAHEKRDPWERPGGTTFHFVNHGIEPH
jgi:dihydrofolate reductase